MNFVDKLNSMLETSEIENNIELSKRDTRYHDILEIIITSCKNAGLISCDDINSCSDIYLWICAMVNIHLMSMMLIDQIDENDVPMDSMMIKEDNINKAKK
ncbi:hypothetical protein [Vibrio harveyi]|uniref:hypothetical protein n=1 Tax=Vibrio harveyi TaxID=669 RepID=UPI003D759279